MNYSEKLYNFSGENEIYVTNTDVPEWIHNSVKYWTMISGDLTNYFSGMQVGNYSMYVISENGNLGAQYLDSSNYNNTYYVFDQYAIRPVLNLNKCAIEGGCITEEIEIEDGCMEDGVTILDNIANTLSSVSKYIIILSIISIFIGLSIFGYNYYKSRKERK